MRRKMLIVITLVTIMLLNCILPILQVEAATEKTTMTFNTALYKGLKAYFQEVDINAIYDDIKHTIKMETSVLNSIEGLSLKEKEIEDLTGLDQFQNVNSLILSANKLSEESNLGVLNNLPNLTYLDLSSNNIKDVSEIQDLIMRLLAIDSNAINLSSQVVTAVTDVSIDVDEQSTIETFDLPQILQIAGIANDGSITNQGNLKWEWIVEDNQRSTRNYSVAPHIINGSISNPVTSTANNFKIEVGVENAGVYTPYEGLVKLVINIKDVSIGGYNTNPSARNILKDSRFTLFYVVHLGDTEGIIFKDKNLYTAVKEQLTRNQQINSELLSYPYSLTSNGEILYDVCDYTLSGDDATLTIAGVHKYTIEDIMTGSGKVYKILASGRTLINIPYEFVDITEVDSRGNVSTKRKVKLPHLNEESRTLYQDHYDEPLALVISDLDLVNKITSLILNDQRISDLSGLEKFIGLESNLNVSYNYIDTLAKIYGLEINKDNGNASVQELFREKKDAMAATKTKILSAYADVKSKREALKEEVKKIEENIEKLALIEDHASAEYTNTQKAIQDSIVKINGRPASDTEEEVVGILDELKKSLNDSMNGLNPYLTQLYSRLRMMYTVFNNEYRLTTLLTPELNYQTETEYEQYLENNKSKESAKNMAKAQVSRAVRLDQAGALSPLESKLIQKAFSLSLSTEEEYPLSAALNKMIQEEEEVDAPRTTWVQISDKFIEIAQYSEAANYCLLERMNNNVAAQECLVKEYFAKKIKEYNYEGIDSTLISAIYEKLMNNTGSGFRAVLYNEFNSYMSTIKTCKDGYRAYACKDTYNDVTKIDFKKVERTNSGFTYTADVVLVETLYGGHLNNDDTYFFDQLIALANKFTANDEISRYVKLPVLKRIDVRNNKIESLGETTVTMVAPDGTETTTTETLASLKNLKEFFAGHNFVSGDISCVDWSTLTALKSLDLSYNYISDILPLEVLKNLRYLDVSDNLLEGAFNVSLRNMEKLKDLKLAGNRYTDISKILLDYEMLAEGDFTRYFAREDTLNIDLSRQKLEIVLEDVIPYEADARVTEVELPPIFAQLEHIDATRTAYGTTSSKGTIEATGGYAYVPVNETGDFKGEVKVIAANGYPEDVTTSIGINTVCTIEYSVKEISVDEVIINEDITRMERGTQETFTATVNGKNVPDTSVEWEVRGASSEGTKMDQEGVLTVAADETATTVTIIATSNYDDTKETSKDIELFTKTVTSVVINEAGSKVEKGKEKTFTATVNGENLEEDDTKVTWSISGNASSDTTVDETGLVKVSADETAEKITLTATSSFDTSKKVSVEVPILVKKVTGVVVSEDTTAVAGTTATFTAVVNGEDLETTDKEVTWSVYGNTTPYTMINPVTGVLTIGEDENATELVVAATSKYDVTKVGTAKVKIIAVKSVKVQSSSNRLNNGATMNMTAEVEGTNLTENEKKVTWSLSGNTSTNTTISSTGVLTIGTNESANEIVVTATSVTRPTLSGSKTIRISAPLPTLGYSIDSEDGTLVVGISPNTASTNFKSRFITDSNYTVTVKRDGREITNTSYVATGDIAVIYCDGRVIESFELVVKGDANGDGLADALDSSLIKAHRARLTTLTGAFLKAADIDGTGEITVKDVRLLLYHRAKIDGYIL